MRQEDEPGVETLGVFTGRKPGATAAPATTMLGVPEDLPIDLVPKSAVQTPRLPGHVTLRTDPDELIDALLADLLIHARNCVRAFGDFHLAISATPEAEPYLRRLMYDLNHRDFPWLRTRVWMVDEFAKDPEQADSRYSRLRDLVLEQSGIHKEQLHRVDPAQPVEAYESELRQHLGWREKGHDRLDYVLLTLGESGGVAGFEVDPVGGEGRLAQPVEGGVSLTMEFINASRVVAVIAGGAERREIIARLCGRGRPESSLPVTHLKPLAGELRWYVDSAACPPPRES